jgi:hypothetical protein
LTCGRYLLLTAHFKQAETALPELISSARTVLSCEMAARIGQEVLFFSRNRYIQDSQVVFVLVGPIICEAKKSAASPSHNLAFSSNQEAIARGIIGAYHSGEGRKLNPSPKTVFFDT